MRELAELPVFRSPAVPFDPRTWRLTVGGLVARPIVLDYAEVLALHAVDDTSPFECVDGWRVAENHWSGVPVGVLLDMAGPLGGARFVTFHAGQFATSLTLEEARAPGVLLAYRLNGAPLAPEHGAPYASWRPVGNASMGSNGWNG